MICEVNNQKIDPSVIGPPAMNFGQKRYGQENNRFKYEYFFSIEEFSAIAYKWFDEFRLEAIEDAENDLPGDFPVYDKYKEEGFPSFNELIINHQTLLAEILLICDLDILNLIEMSSQKKNIRKEYLINSVDNVSVRDVISIEGVAYRI